MTTHLVKHRYLDGGEPGAACTEQIPGYGQCGLSEYATFHWHDGSHPFTGDAGEPCTWVERSGEMCHGQVQNAEHQEAVELEKALDGNHGGVWRTRPVRVPDENEVRVPTVRVPSLAEGLAKGLSVPVPETLGEQFLRGGEVGPGPWSVRQWSLVTRSDEKEMLKFARRLTFLDEAYEMHVWWPDGREKPRVMRLIWGELLGLDEGAIADRLSGWSG